MSPKKMALLTLTVNLLVNAESTSGISSSFRIKNSEVSADTTPSQPASKRMLSTQGCSDVYGGISCSELEADGINLCTTLMYAWTRVKCQSSCGLCGCQNQNNDGYCQRALDEGRCAAGRNHGDREKCALTCNACGDGVNSTTHQPIPQPINGIWSNWRNTGTCTATCGNGQQKRYRSCDNPAPAHGGNNCYGRRESSVSCNIRDCPIVHQAGSSAEVCEDKINWCRDSYCDKHRTWARDNCKKTCNICSSAAQAPVPAEVCEDKVSSCEGHHCYSTLSSLKNWAHTNCKNTCSLCVPCKKNGSECQGLDTDKCLKNDQSGYCDSSQSGAECSCMHSWRTTTHIFLRG